VARAVRLGRSRRLTPKRARALRGDGRTAAGADALAVGLADLHQDHAYAHAFADELAVGGVLGHGDRYAEDEWREFLARFDA
jgi:hypothetical protein